MERGNFVRFPNKVIFKIFLCQEKKNRNLNFIKTELLFVENLTEKCDLTYLRNPFLLH